MARIRYLKPDFFFDEELCAHPFQHRLCYEGLWVNADREGRLEDRPQRLKARIFPYDALDIEPILTDLARAGFIIRYVANGKTYIAIKPQGWAKHQRPRKDEGPSEIPAPNEHSVVYATLGEREALGAALRKTVTVPPLHSDGSVSAEWIGIGMGNGDRNGSSAEALTRSTPVEPPGLSPLQEASELRVRGKTPDDSPGLLVFPTIGAQGREWRLTTRQADEWRVLYPGLDILAEAQKALAWVRAKPDRRKTPRGMPAFLVNWFNRAVNSRRVDPSLPNVMGKRTRALAQADVGFLGGDS
jgi:hypothetical protein